MKLIADYKQFKPQLGTIRVLGMVILALVALGSGIFFSAQRHNEHYLHSLDGQEYPWRDDKWTVINYFAQWCAPCLREIPELNTLYQHGNVRVFAVSYDDLSVDALISVVERLGIDYPLITSASLQGLPITTPAVLPTTYIIAPGGELTHTLRGEITAAQLQGLLPVNRAAAH